MTHEDKLKYMRLACGMCNFNIHEDELDLLLSLYDGVKEKEGSFTINDAIDVKYQVEERKARRKVDEEARQRNKEEQAKKDQENESK